MKKIYCNENSINWNKLGVKALNTHTGVIEDTTTLPDNKYLKVQICEDFDSDFFSSEDVNQVSSRYAVRKGKKRDFILLNGYKVVGYAAYHRKNQPYLVDVDVTYGATVKVMAKNEEQAKRLAEQKICEDADPNVICVEAVNAEREFDLDF